MQFDDAKIKERIKAAISDGGRTERELHDIAFHMTDWLDDLEAYHAFCRDPESVTPANLKQLLTNFLVHVPNHVAAAGKLLLDLCVWDVFGVGAVDMTYEEKAKQFRLRLEVWGDHDDEPVIEFPSHKQIEEAVSKLDGDRLWGAQIQLHDIYAMKIAISKDPEEGGFEYWEGDISDEHAHFECADRRPPLNDVIRGFQQFAMGDHRWKQDFDWRPRNQA
ncbi:MAG: hypothetical protein H6817_06345 [Phycisphaerales bacterium]|nr:hypothetical protein [Phycisphaerales bacterium]